MRTRDTRINTKALGMAHRMKLCRVQFMVSRGLQALSILLACASCQSAHDRVRQAAFANSVVRHAHNTIPTP